jgi:hypothetical protein
MFEYLMGRLDKCPHVGIGEFHLHNVPKDKTLLRKIAATAKRGDL